MSAKDPVRRSPFKGFQTPPAEPCPSCARKDAALENIEARVSEATSIGKGVSTGYLSPETLSALRGLLKLIRDEKTAALAEAAPAAGEPDAERTEKLFQRWDPLLKRLAEGPPPAAPEPVPHKDCVTRMSSTCAYLADGTKITACRDKDAQGRMWIEHKDQVRVGVAAAPEPER